MSKPASRALQVAAVAAGNALEFYDFIIYSTFAIFIGRAYFPAGGPVVSLLLALATFGIGFVTRPIGGVVLGRIGDRIGRKPAMLIAFALMAVGTLAVTFTPTWRQIGIAAPIIVIIARLIQGFALGGEYGPSTAYLVESAEPGRRGLIGSMQGVGQNLAALTAALVALSLSLALSKADLQAWGWRAAFGLGLLIVPFGLIVRRRIEETAPAREQGPAAGGPFPWRLALVSATILAGGTMITYTGHYLSTFAMDSLHLPPSAAFGIGVTGGACAVIFVPLGGWLSDRYGRRAIMIPGAAIAALLVIPAYGVIVRHPSLLAIYAAVVVVGIPGNLAGGALYTAITESFPARMRCTAVGTVYALTIAGFGGTTQFLVAALVHGTGQPMMITYYRFVAGLIFLAGVLALPESAPGKIRASLRPEAALA
jgi:MFS family permease